MPVRSSSRTKATALATAAATMDAQQVDFKHLWRQLKAAGWTARRPRNIETVWTYIRPTNDQPEDGVNVFKGENSVVEYAIKSGLIADDGSSSEEAESEHGEESDAVRASQIDCDVELSANTVNVLFDEQATGAEDDAPFEEGGGRMFEHVSRGLFGSDDEDERVPLLSQGAVARAFELTQSGPVEALDACDREVVVGAFQRLLSETEPESDDQPDEEMKEGEPDDDRVVLMPRDPSDVNVMKPGDVADEYESLVSGSDYGQFSDDDGAQIQRPEPDVDDGDNYPDSASMDAAFIASLGGTLSIEAMNPDALRNMAWTPASEQFENRAPAYPGLVQTRAAPIPQLQAIRASPIALMFYFLPKSLWKRITRETNRYKRETVDQHARLRRRSGADDSLREIRRQLRRRPDYSPREVVSVMGLLVAHMLAPTRRFSQHRAEANDGVLSAGAFGEVMARDRCTELLRDLHFVNNNAPNRQDKLWKIRDVVDVLQERFLSAWTPPNIISFDEGVLPSTSKRNTTRMFMPDKPHRYGTKMFMTCDSASAYCHRFEIYVGKRQATESASQAFDHKTGAAAVIRNLKIVLAGHTGFRLVVIDRFYSSVALAIQLLTMSVYVLGTIMTNRLGFDKAVVEKRATLPRGVDRGSFKFSRSVAVPTMVACHWWDRKPVHYLATGVVLWADTIKRNLKGVGQSTFNCPALVTDYQRWMGGVDVHDQLRLQAYSIQLSFRMRKYYKSLFLGLLDLALVNAYLTHKEACKIAGEVPTSRYDWLNLLHKQLIKVKDEDFLADATPPHQTRKRARPSTAHTQARHDDWVVVNGVQKRRPRSCKVCSIYRGDKKKSFQTSHYCVDCSKPNAKCYLCKTTRRNETRTCFQVWHEDLACGTAIPEHLNKRIVLRRTKPAGTRKKTRRELLRAEDGDDGDDEADEQVINV